jgi:hypothetical protein
MYFSLLNFTQFFIYLMFYLHGQFYSFLMENSIQIYDVLFYIFRLYTLYLNKCKKKIIFGFLESAN